MSTEELAHPGQDADVFSDRGIMLIVGLIALFLSPLVWLMNWFLCDALVPATSVSQYYFTGGHSFFVGGLVTIGILLLTYKGWNFSAENMYFPWSTQYILSLSAGICALIVGVVPTELQLEDSTNLCVSNLQCVQLGKALNAVRLTSFPVEWEHVIHLSSAFLLFSWLTYTAFYRFTEHSGDTLERQAPNRKKMRNHIYRICAYLMFLGMILCFVEIFAANVIGINLRDCHIFFIGETMALEAFGFAWFVKSRWLFGYPNQGYGLWLGK